MSPRIARKEAGDESHRDGQDDARWRERSRLGQRMDTRHWGVITTIIGRGASMAERSSSWR
ncbi:hypothetical protein CR513_42834, partial [Mucuna pruriens]